MEACVSWKRYSNYQMRSAYRTFIEGAAVTVVSHTREFPCVTRVIRVGSWTSRLKLALFSMLTLLFCAPVFAQPPANRALMLPQSAPELNYADTAGAVTVPPGNTMGPPASVAFNSKGHLFVLNRGPQPVMEFDASGTFIQSFGEVLSIRPHGVGIDSDDNIWATDGGAHIVVKFNSKGQVLLTLGKKGEAGEWNEATGSHRFNQPNAIAFGRNGDVFVVQGHTEKRGDPRVLKFDKDGHFIKSWGGTGTEPGKFQVAHGIAVDSKGFLWVADRENQRIQVFDQDGTFIKEMKVGGLPCSLSIGEKYVYLVNGLAGQLLRLDLNGKALAATGRIGKGLGEFGEAHSIAVSTKGEIWIADTQNITVHKFVER